MELNKKKFRVFIREKQAKIEDGVARCDKEKLLQDQRVRDLKDLKRDFKIHNHAKVLKHIQSVEHFLCRYLSLSRKCLRDAARNGRHTRTSWTRW